MRIVLRGLCYWRPRSESSGGLKNLQVASSMPR